MRQIITILPKVKFGAVDDRGNIYLGRRGSSAISRCMVPGEFYLENGPDRVHVHVKGMPDVGVDFTGEDALQKGMELINKGARVEYKLPEATHGFCYGNPVKGDVYVSPVRYESGSDTIRHVPTNICLVKFDGGEFSKPILDFDAASAPWRDHISKALDGIVHSRDIACGDDHCKRMLAWLAGRYILEAIQEPTVCAVLADDMESDALIHHGYQTVDAANQSAMRMRG